MIARDPVGPARSAPYYLAPAGEQLIPTLRSLWQWAEHWVPEDPTMAQRDPSVIAWWLAHRVDVNAVPLRQVAIELRTQDGDADVWLLLARGAAPTLCIDDPLIGEDRYVYVEADAAVLFPIARGSRSWRDAIADGSVRPYGEPQLVPICRPGSSSPAAGLGPQLSPAWLSRPDHGPARRVRIRVGPVGCSVIMPPSPWSSLGVRCAAHVGTLQAARRWVRRRSPRSRAAASRSGRSRPRRLAAASRGCSSWRRLAAPAIRKSLTSFARWMGAPSHTTRSLPGIGRSWCPTQADRSWPACGAGRRVPPARTSGNDSFGCSL